MHRDVLGVTTPGEQGANLLSNKKINDVPADDGDRPGHLKAEDGAGPRRRRIESCGLKQVGAIDSGGLDFDHNLADTGFDVRHLLPRQLAGGVGDDGVHAVTVLRIGRARIIGGWDRYANWWWRGRAA